MQYISYKLINFDHSFLRRKVRLIVIDLNRRFYELREEVKQIRNAQ